MQTRRQWMGGAAAAAGLMAQGARAQTPRTNPWTLPSDDHIAEVLAERVDRQKRAVGYVVGVVDANGRRFVARGAARPFGGRPLDADTVFQIGSVSKVFATLLLADMVQRGEVGLDDPASAYLPPGVAMPLRGRPITLEHLATHLSGLPSMPTNFDLKARPNPVAAYSPEDLHDFLSSYEPARAPGEAWAYSNLGVALLGRLLARRAGTSYEALLKARVLRPLGLASTAIRLNSDQARRLAPGHDMYLQPVDTWEMRTLQASGSLRSSARDLLSFVEAHLGFRKAPLASAMAFQTGQPTPANSPGQSLGWALRRNTTFGETDFLHDGGKEGYRSFVAFDRGAKRGVVILTNTRTEERLDALALHILSGRTLRPLAPLPPRPPAPRVVTPAASLRTACEGRYRTSDGAVLAVACLGPRLLLDTVGEGVSEFFAAGEGHYFSKVDDSRLDFDLGGGGKAGSLTLTQGGKPGSAQRL